MKAVFKDNFHFSFSPTLVQPQYPVSKEHSSSIAAMKEVNRTRHVRRGILNTVYVRKTLK